MINCADVPDVVSAGFQHRHSSYLLLRSVLYEGETLICYKERDRCAAR